MQMMCQNLKRAAFIEINQAPVFKQPWAALNRKLALQKGFIKCLEGA
jgi:hypothetical protein